jgi:hypothetical protein
MGKTFIAIGNYGYQWTRSWFELYDIIKWIWFLTYTI